MGSRHVVAVAVGALALGLLPQVALDTAAARPRPVTPAPTSTGTATSRAHAAGTTVRVGSLDLTPCDVTDGALCGTLARRWDPTGAVPGTLDVGFAFVPASDTSHAALGTVVPHEGGPGYSTTGSADSYAAMYGSLLTRRNLLLVDQRGTGLTAAIDCPELQDLVGPYARAAARCARRLAPRAHLYGTALSADDLAAVVTALGLGRVDVYGDSYGTFFTQVYASRHPKQVRSLVLDSAYPTYGETAWYPTQDAAMRGSFDLVCRRTPTCARFGVRTSARIASLVQRVRRHPIVGRAYAGDGRVHRLVLDAPTLVSLAFNATYGPVTYRELDAAIRALFSRRDARPLLRLVGELEFPGGGTSAAADYSEGADAAVACMDYPQLYAMTASTAVRRTQLTAAVKTQLTRNAGVYAPFTINEYMRSTWSELDWCLTWPTAPSPYRQGPIRPPGGRYPSSVPVLVLSGQLDSITTPAEGAIVARQWPSATQVTVASSFHVTADVDTDGCAVSLLRAWVLSPRRATVRSHDACAARVPPVRAARAFPLRSTDEPVATPLRGSTRSRVRLAAVRAVTETVADLLDRWMQTYEPGGVGLRGGRWTADGDSVVTLRLSRLRFVTDLAVSGTVVWDRYAHLVSVDVTTIGTTSRGVRVRGSALTGALIGTWDTRAAGARATVVGTLGGQPVRTRFLAP